jgi:hypothetical protein
MAHDPSLAYADYFAAAGGVTTLVPEVDAAGEDEGHLYGGMHAHHHGFDMFGARGLVPGATVVAEAHGKGAALGDFALGAEHLRLLGHSQQAPLTSLSLHGPAEAASLALHHHQLGGGGALRQHQPAAWPPQPQQQQGGAWHLRGSRFLRPTQQLLQEFCGLPVEAASKPLMKLGSEDGAGEGSSSSAPSAQIQAMDAAELQRLKAKLYAMLQEVVLSNRSSLATARLTIAHSTGPPAAGSGALACPWKSKKLQPSASSTMACLKRPGRLGQARTVDAILGASPPAFGNLQRSILRLAADVAMRLYRATCSSRRSAGPCHESHHRAAAAQISAELALLHY